MLYSISVRLNEVTLFKYCKISFPSRFLFLRIFFLIVICAYSFWFVVWYCSVDEKNACKANFTVEWYKMISKRQEINWIKKTSHFFHRVNENLYYHEDDFHSRTFLFFSQSSNRNLSHLMIKLPEVNFLFFFQYFSSNGCDRVHYIYFRLIAYLFMIFFLTTTKDC